MMKWGPSEIATIWALVSGIVAVVAAWGGWKNGKNGQYTKTIDLLKEQVEAMQLDVDRNKALLEQSAREVFNITVRFEQQQVNYKALGAKFLDATARIAWLERREKQFIRFVTAKGWDVPEPENEVDL
jgi:nitric oxide synthase oxygenase domain/subunit